MVMATQTIGAKYRSLRSLRQRLRYAMGWLLVRPRRYLFHRMIAASVQTRWAPEKHPCGGVRWPNPHWRLLYLTVFRFFKWLDWEAWRPLCKWEGGLRRTFPWPARVIRRIGATTAGFACRGGECFHCASPDGDPVDLSEDETGTTFILAGTHSLATMDGTDHQFWGTTICPKCGFKKFYWDGSL